MRFGWVDFSSEERRRVMQAIKALETSGTIDELGIGVIRDGFADQMFPGISVLQTRAKYYITVPDIYRSAMRDTSLKSPNEVSDFIHGEEDKIAASLRDKGNYGVIGERGPVRYKPSFIYWSGLRTFGIVRSGKISQSAIVRKIAAFHRRDENAEAGRYDRSDELDDESSNLYDVSADFNFFEGNVDSSTLDLSKREAEYLYEKIKSSQAKDSLLVWLLDYSISNGIPEKLDDIDKSLLPQNMGNVLARAIDFRNLIYGAHLLYNVLYAQHLHMDGERQRFEDAYSNWRNKFDFDSFDEEAVLSAARAGRNSDKQFIRDFYRYAKTNDDKIRTLIRERERFKKQGNSKLFIDVPEGADIKYSSVHDFELEYRYSTVKTIIEDIAAGLKREDKANV